MWLMVVTAALAAEWSSAEHVDGINVQSRPVAGSKVVELKLETTVYADAQRLCDEAFGRGKLDPEEPNLKARTVLQEQADERVTYEQISAPVVSDRDYAVRAKRERNADGSCRITFEAANELAPEIPKGFVRITQLKGEWLFTPQGKGLTHLQYRVHSDPAGSLPAFMVEGTRRDVAVKWVKMMVARASRAKSAPDSVPSAR